MAAPMIALPVTCVERCCLTRAKKKHEHGRHRVCSVSWVLCVAGDSLSLVVGASHRKAQALIDDLGLVDASGRTSGHCELRWTAERSERWARECWPSRRHREQSMAMEAALTFVGGREILLAQIVKL